MKIIVTGGAGFIGGNFVHHMVNKYPEYQIINLILRVFIYHMVNKYPEYQIDDLILRVFIYHMVYEVSADESGSACHDNLHCFNSF